MLICDKRLLRMRTRKIYAIIALLTMVSEFVSLSSIDTSYRILLLIIFGLGLTFSGYYWFRLRHVRNIVIFGEITCGEISDLLVFLDGIISNPAIISSDSKSFSAKHIEGCVEKLIVAMPSIGVNIKNFLENYGVLRSIKSHQRKMTVFAVCIIFMIIFLLFIPPIISPSHPLSLLNMTLPFILILFLVIMYLALIKTNPPQIFHDISEHDIDKLREAIVGLIDAISRRISEPLAISLTAIYPGTKRQENYVVILPKA